MAKPLLSLVYATYDRGHLLRRAVECVNRSEFDLSRLEVVCVDDGSTDDTADVVRGYDPRIDLKYLRLRKTPGLWRDTGAVINAGLRAAAGGVVVLTHPEILVGRRSLAWCLDQAADDVYVCCKGYYLSDDQQAAIDTVPWREEGPLAARRFPDFYAPGPGHPDYQPAAVERIPTWESWIFGGHTRRLWARLGGMYETDRWGAVDLNWLARRRALGIQNRTGADPDTYVLHQAHPAPRRMDDAFSQARGFTPAEAAWPAVDHLWGPIP